MSQSNESGVVCYCTPKKSHLESTSAIECEVCNEWVYLECLGLTQEQLESIEKDPSIIFSCPKHQQVCPSCHDSKTLDYLENLQLCKNCVYLEDDLQKINNFLLLFLETQESLKFSVETFEDGVSGIEDDSFNYSLLSKLMPFISDQVDSTIQVIDCVFDKISTKVNRDGYQLIEIK